MRDPSHDLRRLQEALDTVRPKRAVMLVAELDGYLAALIVCSETVEPSEWLPGIWGGDKAFVDAAQAEAAIAKVMEYYARTARQLAVCPEEYAPVLQIDSGIRLWTMVTGLVFEWASRSARDGRRGWVAVLSLDAALVNIQAGILASSSGLTRSFLT